MAATHFSHLASAALPRTPPPQMGRFRTSAMFLAATHFTHLATTARGLQVALLTGSTRTSSPPTVLHPRVNAYIRNELERRGHAVSHVDPKDLPLLEKPHFAYPKGKAPARMREIHSILEDAACYVCITPEYNHSPSPALLNILNYFGSSTFSFKPSAIVTYSAGQWGGARAGVSLRTTLGELGCLPVSAMIHIPRAQEVLDPDGSIDISKKENNNDPLRWQKYYGRCFSQLEWWAEATRRHRELVDPFDESPAFVESPDQRNV